jgi:sec-independent protein translocase protein TatA
MNQGDDMLGNMGPWQILLILAVILLIFGAARLPALAKSIGQSARVFKGEMKQMKDDGTGEKDSAVPSDSATATNESAATPSAKPDNPDTRL